MKIVFVFCNFLFLAMGLAMIIVGCVLRISQFSVMAAIPNDEFQLATALMISSGVIVLIVCVAGFCGVWMENQCILCLYFVCVLVIFAMELAAGIIGYIFRDKVNEKLQQIMIEGLVDESKRDAWHDIQKEFECCGIHNYTDWRNVKEYADGTDIPESCCYGGCGLTGMDGIHEEGCYDRFLDWIQKNTILIGVAGIVLGVLQILLMVVTLCLVFFIRREKVMI
ncbi:hypothetical protein ScPMuIL_015243 [Solemya velum]